MRNKKAIRIIKNICIRLLIGVPLFVNALVRYDCNYNRMDLHFEKKNGWDFIQLKGLGLIEESGKPILPVDYIHLIIPEGQEACSIAVMVESSFKISGTYKIKPFIPYNDSSLIDSAVSLTSEPYPGKRAEIVGTGSFGGNRIVDIKVYPLDYSPKRGEIVLYSDFSIELLYQPSKKSPVKQLSRTLYTKRIIRKSLMSIVDNDYDLRSYSYEPALEENSPKGKSNPLYPTYLIITADFLIDSFQPLIHWITKKGIKANAISVDSILQNYSYDPVSAIYDSAGAIRAFLMDAYENGTQWVLLGGDEEIVPVRYGTSENNDSSVIEQPPSDLYYASLNGNWNVDEDGLYGEPIDDSVDNYPELFVGRLPCSNKEEINNWIEKVLSYEKNPGNGNYDYLTRVFWTAADEMRDFPDYIIGNGSYPSNFSHDTTMLEDFAYTGGYFPKGSDVVAQMNNNFGWFNLYGHGAPDQLTVSALHFNEAGPDRDFLVSVDSCDVYFENLHPNGCVVETGNGLDSLNNKDYYGVMSIFSCYQGAYDFEQFDFFVIACGYCGPSMAEAFTMLPDRGGPAFLGYTRYAKDTPSEVHHLKFLETLFDDSLSNIGVTEAISKTKVFPHFIHLSFTLFGCPLMPVWTDLPSHLDVRFNDSIPPDSSDFEVMVKSSGTPAVDAYVCLWKGDEVYATGFSGEDGMILLPIKPETEGEMLITVTGENFIPFEDTVHVSFYASIDEDTMNSPPFCRTKRIISQSNVLFEFFIPTSDRVQLDIYDLTGRKIKTLLDRKLLSKGDHQVSWSGITSNEKHIRNGIYFYQFHYKDQNIKGKFLLIK